VHSGLEVADLNSTEMLDEIALWRQLGFPGVNLKLWNV